MIRKFRYPRYRLRIMPPGAAFRFMVVLTFRDGEEREGFGDTPGDAEAMALDPMLYSDLIVPRVDPGRHRLMNRIAWRQHELACNPDWAELREVARLQAERSPIANGHGKMSPQAAVGYGNWPDEDGRQSKHRTRPHNGKRKTLRTHRDGESR